jgi:ABC-type transport system involved in cytochrome bd biosynthesis fused ATPase/permease subunit
MKTLILKLKSNPYFSAFEQGFIAGILTFLIETGLRGKIDIETFKHIIAFGIGWGIREALKVAKEQKKQLSTEVPMPLQKSILDLVEQKVNEKINQTAPIKEEQKNEPAK